MTDKFEFVDTCFTTHHLNFDKNGVLWTSSGGGGGVVGWVDTKKWDATHDAAASQGWTPLVVDTKGDGHYDLLEVETRNLKARASTTAPACRSMRTTRRSSRSASISTSPTRIFCTTTSR